MNSENKSQLVDVMNDVWCSHKFAPKLAWKKIITVPRGNCYLLASEYGTTVNKTEITSLFLNQKETDTVSMHKARLWYSSHSQFWQWCVFHIAAPCFQDITISFDTGSDNTRRLLIVIHIANNDGSSALHFCLFAHSRVGEIKPIKLSQKTVRFQDVN